MEDDRENQQESHDTESRSIEETKPGGSGRRSDVRNYRRHETESRFWPDYRETEDSALRINEPGQIRENLQQQRHRDVEMLRRSHGTESRFWQHKRDRSPDWRGSGSRGRFDERTLNWRGSSSQWRLDDRTQRRHELVQSSAHPVRRHKNDCHSYLQTGNCRYGRSCRYNHPNDLPQDWRASESEWRTQRRHETESVFRPEKRSKAIPDSRLRDPRETFEDISERRHEIEWGFERERMEQIERQRRWAQDNLQEQRSRERFSRYRCHEIVRGYNQAKEEEEFERQRRDAQEYLQEQRQRDYIERQRREHNLQEEQRQRDYIERQRREHNLQQEQRQRYYTERQRPEAQDHLQEQRQRYYIERQRREARDNLQNPQEQRQRGIGLMRSTPQYNPMEPRQDVELMRSTPQYNPMEPSEDIELMRSTPQYNPMEPPSP